jgi:hypothetical protein
MGGLSSNQFVTNEFLGALDPRRVSRASHYASEKIFKKFLEFLGVKGLGDLTGRGRDSPGRRGAGAEPRWCRS